jgi:hypothetical protein
MKTDTIGQAIRHLAAQRGLLVEVEQLPALDGEGVGLQDQAALEFLRGAGGR